MSKLIPRRTIDAVRQMVDVALSIIGIECVIYIPTAGSYSTAEKLDVWSEQSDYTYTSYSGMVFVEWNASTRKLKQLGLFVEGGLPILGRFGNKLTALEGSSIGVEAEVDIPIRSYFRISPEYIPSDYAGIEDFEIVDIAIDQQHDAVLTKMYSIAPRRLQKS